MSKIAFFAKTFFFYVESPKPSRSQDREWVKLWEKTRLLQHVEKQKWSRLRTTGFEVSNLSRFPLAWSSVTWALLKMKQLMQIERIDPWNWRGESRGAECSVKSASRAENFKELILTELATAKNIALVKCSQENYRIPRKALILSMPSLRLRGVVKTDFLRSGWYLLHPNLTGYIR